MQSHITANININIEYIAFTCIHRLLQHYTKKPTVCHRKYIHIYDSWCIKLINKNIYGLTNLKQISLFKVSDLKGVLNIIREFYPTNLIIKGTP